MPYAVSCIEFKFPEIIETYWNVNYISFKSIEEAAGNNRNILECKLAYESSKTRSTGLK